jgi:integrase
LRRSELIDLTFDHIQRREDHWAIVDLVEKAAHVRTVPMPDWVKETLVSVQTTEKYLGCNQRLRGAVNDRIGIEPGLKP